MRTAQSLGTNSFWPRGVCWTSRPENGILVLACAASIIHHYSNIFLVSFSLLFLFYFCLSLGFLFGWFWCVCVCNIYLMVSHGYLIRLIKMGFLASLMIGSWNDQAGISCEHLFCDLALCHLPPQGLRHGGNVRMWSNCSRQYVCEGCMTLIFIKTVPNRPRW